MAEKHDIGARYKNKKVLPADQVSILQQIDAAGAFQPYRLLYDISDFERQNYWESAINRFDENKLSAMHHCVDLLIAAHPYRPRRPRAVKLSPDAMVLKNENPWYRAVRIFLFLLNAGASINSRKIHQFDVYETPLEYAIMRGAPRDVLKLLVQHGACVNAFEFNGFTPLMAAVYYLDVDAVDVLVHAGADVNAFYEDGDRILHQVLRRIYDGADFNKCRRIIEILLKHGANPSLLGYDGEDCLQYAIFRSRHGRYIKEAELGISREMIELRRLFRKYGRNFKIVWPNRNRYIRNHTWCGRDQKTGRDFKDTRDAQRAWREIENINLTDSIVWRMLAGRPIAAATLARARAAGIDLDTLGAILTAQVELADTDFDELFAESE